MLQKIGIGKKDHVYINIEQCSALSFQDLCYKFFLGSFNMESFVRRPDGKQGGGDY